MMDSVPMQWRKLPQRYRLEGNRCTTCDTPYFPPRTICVQCRSKGNLMGESMPHEGTIVSFSEVAVGPKGFDGPYHIALVDLTNGVRLLTQIIDAPGIAIGVKVRKIFRKLQDNVEEGAIVYGYKFELA
ncbi:MAG: Zn-ribbon domain-containing OB-fold protein [Nanoarchaeota archaeon]